MTRSQRRSAILGTGSDLPTRVVTNRDLEKMVDTSDEWITVRTGIKERRVLENGKGNADMAFQAARRALADAGMEAKEVFKIAVRSMEEVSRQALAEANVDVEQVSLVIPHQANRRIIVALAERLGVGMEKVMVNVDRYGNTSAASIPVALDEAKRQGRIKPGHIVLLNAFGAGFAWGAAVVKF